MCHCYCVEIVAFGGIEPTLTSSLHPVFTHFTLPQRDEEQNAEDFDLDFSARSDVILQDLLSPKYNFFSPRKRYVF